MSVLYYKNRGQFNGALRRMTHFRGVAKENSIVLPEWTLKTESLLANLM